MKVVYILYYGTSMEFIAGNIKAVHAKMYSLTPPDKKLYCKTYFWCVRALKQKPTIFIPIPFSYDFSISKRIIQTKFIN